MGLPGAPHPIGALLQRLSGGGAPGGPGRGGMMSPMMPGMPPPAPPAPMDPGMILADLARMPSPHKEQAALKLAQDVCGLALQSISMRSPKVAKEIAAGLINLRQAQSLLTELPSQDVSPPPPMMPAGGGMMGDLTSASMPGF